MRIVALSVCNRFWRRLHAVSDSWGRTVGKFGGDLRFVVGTLDGQQADVEEQRLVGKGIQIQRLDPEAHLVDGVPSKPSMLRELMKREVDNSTTHILLTDCDIIYPPEFGPWSLTHLAPYQIAERVDLDAMQTAVFMSNGRLPEDIYSMETNPKKPGMGWFQLIRREAFMMATRQMRWEHYSGYDVFDWELNRNLSATLHPAKVASSPFVHLWHGEPGSTWKGVQEDC